MRAARLRQAARHALEYYDLPVRRLSLLGNYTNSMFRVDAADGTAYALRICAPGWRTEEDLRAEIAWLQALSRAPEIGAPLPITARDGGCLIKVEMAGEAEARRCLLTSWLPGGQLAKHLTEKNLERMGALFARLHRFSLDFVPPPDFTRRRMERVLARGEEDALFSASCQAGLPERARGLLARVAQRVEGAFARRYADPRGLRVIHNDLWHGNIKLYRGRLYPLDFEDTLWGYPVQDIAMAAHDLMTDVPREAFEPLLAALRRGYERLEPWPEDYADEMDTFRAGRELWVANYVARVDQPHLAGYLERIAPMLEQFLETGALRKVR